MNIKEFYDLGFVTEFVDETPVCRKVEPFDEHYEEIFEYAKTHTYKEVESFAWEFHYRLNSIGSSGTDDESHVTSVNMNLVDEDSHRVIIALGDVRLDIYCNKKTGFIYSIWDRFPYIDAWVDASSYLIYEHYGTDRAIHFSNSEYYIHNAKEFIVFLFNKRKEDAQNIRNHYNQEIKKLKQEYKFKLSRSHLGTKSLDKLIV